MPSTFVLRAMDFVCRNRGFAVCGPGSCVLARYDRAVLSCADVSRALAQARAPRHLIRSIAKQQFSMDQFQCVATIRASLNCAGSRFLCDGGKGIMARKIYRAASRPCRLALCRSRDYPSEGVLALLRDYRTECSTASFERTISVWRLLGAARAGVISERPPTFCGHNSRHRNNAWLSR